ncbi:MAG: 4-hydroxybenzoate octaprenyltransferase, partial [Calditrichia bacterium]
MQNIKNLGSFIKVEHTLFSLPLILSGTFLAANGLPSLRLLFLIILAGIGARTSALALNRIIDRDIDKKNPRTRTRELPSGKMSSLSALSVAIVGTVIYFFSSYLICDLVFYLSPIPLIIFILYPYMKRFTPLCHFGVGLGLALAPLGGWIAVTCSLNNLYPAILLSLFTFFWVSGFDIIYATLDEESDRETGVFSMVSTYGRVSALRLSGVLHLLSFLSLAVLYLIYFEKSFFTLFF